MRPKSLNTQKGDRRGRPSSRALRGHSTPMGQLSDGELCPGVGNSEHYSLGLFSFTLNSRKKPAGRNNGLTLGKQSQLCLRQNLPEDE